MLVVSVKKAIIITEKSIVLETYFYSILSVVVVSLISLIGVLTLSIEQKKLEKMLHRIVNKFSKLSKSCEASYKLAPA